MLDIITAAITSSWECGAYFIVGVIAGTAFPLLRSRPSLEIEQGDYLASPTCLYRVEEITECAVTLNTAFLLTEVGENFRQEVSISHDDLPFAGLSTLSPLSLHQDSRSLTRRTP